MDNEILNKSLMDGAAGLPIPVVHNIPKTSFTLPWQPFPSGWAYEQNKNGTDAL